MANPSKLTLAFVNKRPLAAARVLETLSVQDAAEFVAAIPVRYATKILSPLNPMVCSGIVQALPEESMTAVLRDMEFANAAAVLRRIDTDLRDRILAGLPDARRTELLSVLQFAAGTVGANMTTSVVIAARDETVKSVLSRLLADKDGVCDAVFVVDDKQKLLGSVLLSTLVRQRGRAVMDDLMNDLSPPISARSQLSQIADHPAWAHSKQLPVVSRRGDLLGVLYRHTVLAEKNKGYATTASNTPTVVGSLLQLMWGSATDVVRPSSTETANKEGVSNEQ